MVRRTILLLLLVQLSLFSNGQQRLGLDINTTGLSMNFTFSYQKVVMNHFLINAGTFGGLLSFSSDRTWPLNLNDPIYVSSPLNAVNTPISINDTIYGLTAYELKGRGIGVQLGLGYFHEFSVKHGIKFFLNGRFGISRTAALSHYHCSEIPNELERLYYQNHLFAAVSPEINHTIRLTGRYTFSYGFKFPYYFLIDKDTYNTMKVKDGFYGLEPEFKIGLTYVIGKCDE